MSETQKSRWDCKVDGCTHGRASGHAIHRTSPKGELFEGVCTEHYDGEPDPIAVAIEQRNAALRAEHREDETQP